uniref:type II toxin-antitoxin system HipA family toxin n=1 Tax=Cellulomonas sp. ACRRI TaxID=2918188 RepID=UPI001EF2FE9C|nr:HipA domain-containing protein [Cellulomonas sp. ACRRI]MCG7288237.1 HipA domain-containing protein [Cellulomonas sp. ACRRI]
MSRVLHVWLRGRHLAELEQLRNGRLRMRYDSEALDTWGIGARPLSLSLPLTEKRVQGDHLERFLDNLLPEGAVRGALERQHRIRPGDTFALLARIGRECAGAIQLTDDDGPAPDGHLVPLTAAEVDRIVSNLPTLEPPEGEVVSASLGGIQSKVLLTRTRDGWAWPAAGAMSTHIIKPEPVTDVGPADLIRWEDWTLRVARAAGLPAAHTELADFDGRLALVVERFDRTHGRRSHQEDFTQALGVAARDKYESGTGEERLRRIAVDAGVEAVDPVGFVTELVGQLAFNLIVGNGDAHSKNYSLAIDETATFSMAPLYDVAPVYLLNPMYQSFGHSLDGTGRLRHLTAGHLVRESTSWGADPEVVARTVATVATRVRTALGEVVAHGIDTARVAEGIDERARAALEVTGSAS